MEINQNGEKERKEGNDEGAAGLMRSFEGLKKEKKVLSITEKSAIFKLEFAPPRKKR